MCVWMYCMLYIQTDIHVSIAHATGIAAGYQKQKIQKQTSPSLRISAAAPHAFFFVFVVVAVVFYGLIVSYYCPLCFYSRSGFFIFVFYFYFDFAFHFAFCPHKNKNKNLLCHISLSLSLFFRWCFVFVVVFKLVLFLASLFIYSTYVSHTFSV